MAAAPAAAVAAAPTAPAVHVFETAAKLSAGVAEYIAARSAEAVKARGVFRVAFSGGSLPKLVAAGLLAAPARAAIAFDHWEVYFADERCVGAASPDSNFKLVSAELLAPLAASAAADAKAGARVRDDTVVPIDFALIADPAACAAAYGAALLKRFGADVSKAADGKAPALPVFDLVLLGMGEDGHTCSLFPGHKLVTAAGPSSAAVEPITDSPKPPPSRVTLSLRAVNAARAAAFVATGAGKRPVLTTVFGDAAKGRAAYPCAMVQPANGSAVQWFIDSAAAPAPAPAGAAAAAAK